MSKLEKKKIPKQQNRASVANANLIRICFKRGFSGFSLEILQVTQPRLNPAISQNDAFKCCQISQEHSS